MQREKWLFPSFFYPFFYQIGKMCAIVFST